ncbi:MAG: L-lactate MFS transporter [Tepidisphaeraceae bacterium]
MLSFLDYERSVAKPGFNRWLVPPAALAVHLSIGQVYALSVFKLPLNHLIGGSTPAPNDWSQSSIAYIFSIAIAFLGISAAVFGKWLERAGPRRAMFYAALCFGGGFFVSAIGVKLHMLWLLYLGYGVLGGIGLGLGYISPVSTLIKWFADRPGMATGMAIMGFGGGAMIGGPLAVLLMSTFKSGPTHGVMPAMLIMGALYGLFMIFGAFLVRVPPKGWLPEGYVRPAHQNAMITSRSIDAGTAIKTPQFWLLWVVLCTNVTAGIGILEQASPMIQELFKGRVTPAAAGGFVGLLSLFNMIGRFGWSSLSDVIGRKPTYMIFLLIGAALYAFLPQTGASRFNSLPLFVGVSVILLSMYGGGFATIPAYLRDLFGTANVSAIHGRLLTAWSVAGILGPTLVNSLRESQLHNHVAPANAYAIVLYVMAGLLVVGFVANLLVRPVSEKYHSMDSDEPHATSAAVHHSHRIS